MSGKKVAIGIDLGTTKCCVAVVRDGKVEILENERSRKTTPSYVAFTDSERLIGEDAKDQVTLNPTNTVFRVKGIIGRGTEDSKVTKATTEMPYIIVDDAGSPFINVTYKKKEEALLPQQVTAMLLTKMKEMAQERLGCSVEDAVISVPSSFSNAQRQATKDAAIIAGLNVLTLINEPTAAAIAYQANRKEKARETIAVVDFGGGKLDVAIVSVNNASVTVKGFSGSTDLGGNYVDEILMAYVQEKFRGKFARDPPNGDSVLERLRSACVKLKNCLSLLPRVQDQLDCFGDDFLLPVSIDSAKYRDMISIMIQSGLKTHFDRALEISDQTMQSISRVVLVGGATRIPLVPDVIQGYFGGNKLDRSVNPDEAIAQGAAIYAALLSGNNTVDELAVNDILPNSFCFTTQGCSDMHNLFSNGEVIPSTKRVSIDEIARCLKFELYEELSGTRNPHRLIGTLCLSDEFNKSVRLVSEVVYEIDQCGIFDVMIQLGPSTDSSYIFRDVVKNYSLRLNADRLQKFVTRELEFRQDVKEEMDRVEAYTNLESCCFRLQGTMETTKGRQHLPDLVEQIKTEAGKAIVWLDTEVNVSKSDCLNKLKSLAKLERNLDEELYRLEKIEKERTAAKNALKLFLAKVQTFLTGANVSDEEEKAEKVREQMRLVGKWLTSETNPSKTDCDEKRVTVDNVFSILVRALEVREEERAASVMDLQTWCRVLLVSVTNKPIDEALLPLVTELTNQANDTLKWLESNDKLASKKGCNEMKSFLKEKMKILQRKTELREQEKAAQREKLVTLWRVGSDFSAKVQSSVIGIHDTGMSTYILNQVAEVLAWHKEKGENMSKTECDKALELMSNLEGLFSTWVKDHEEKMVLQKLEQEQAEAARRREMEQTEHSIRQNNDQAEADKTWEMTQSEAVKIDEKEQAEAVQMRENTQAEVAKTLVKEKSGAANNLEKERTDALKSFEHKWTSLEATLSLDALKKVKPDLVNQAMQCAEQTLNWLKSPRSFSSDEYKKRLETLKKLGQDLQSMDQQLRANGADVDCENSDFVMTDAESESETEHDKSYCSVM